MSTNNGNDSNGNDNSKDHTDKRAKIAVFLIVPAFIIIALIVFGHWHYTTIVLDIANTHNFTGDSFTNVMDKLDTQSQSIYNILIPVFAGWVTAVVAFYFGSSQAEKAAEKQIETQRKAFESVDGKRAGKGKNLESEIKKLLDYDEKISQYLTISIDDNITDDWYNILSNEGLALVSFAPPTYYDQSYEKTKGWENTFSSYKNNQQTPGENSTKNYKFRTLDNVQKNEIVRLLNLEQPDEEYLRKMIREDLDKDTEVEITVKKDPEDPTKFSTEELDSAELLEYWEMNDTKLHAKFEKLLDNMNNNLPKYKTLEASAAEKYYKSKMGLPLGILYAGDLGELDSFQKYVQTRGSENPRTLAELFVSENIIDTVTNKAWILDPDKRIANFAEVYLDDTIKEAKSKLTEVSDNPQDARALILDDKDKVKGIASGVDILAFI